MRTPDQAPQALLMHRDSPAAKLAMRAAVVAALLLTAGAPVRADWTTVRADGTVVTTPSNSRTQSEALPEDEYASESFDGPDAQRRAAPLTRRSRDESAREERGERNTRSASRARRQGQEREVTVNINVAPNYGSVPGAGGYNAYGGWAAPNYGYYPYPTYPGSQTIVVPPVAYSGPIAPPALPWVTPPWITSIPLGTTVITSPGHGHSCSSQCGHHAGHHGRGYAGNYHNPHSGYPYPAGNYGFPSAGYPIGGYPIGGYSPYPNGTSTHSYGGITMGRGGVSVSIGGSRTTSSTTYSTGIYR
jgi:hypothetical protein